MYKYNYLNAINITCLRVDTHKFLLSIEMQLFPLSQHFSLVGDGQEMKCHSLKKCVTIL